MYLFPSIKKKKKKLYRNLKEEIYFHLGELLLHTKGLHSLIWEKL